MTNPNQITPRLTPHRPTICEMLRANMIAANYAWGEYWQDLGHVLSTRMLPTIDNESAESVMKRIFIDAWLMGHGDRDPALVDGQDLYADPKLVREYRQEIGKMSAE